MIEEGGRRSQAGINTVIYNHDVALFGSSRQLVINIIAKQFLPPAVLFTTAASMSLVQFLVDNEPLFRQSRLPSLYSDLSNLRITNPEGFAANSQAWTSALTLLALSGKLPTEQRVILSCSDNLLVALSSPNYGRPVGLGAVLDDVVRDGKMIDVADFTSADKSIYARTWIPSPWAILKWSLRTAGLTGHGSYDKSGNLKNGDLVLVPVLEDISKKILAWQQRQGQAPTDRIYTRESFSSAVSALLSSQEHSLLNSKDLDVLLLYLSRDKPILSYDDKVVKLKPLTATKPEPVTSEDNAVANLKSLISSLTAQTEALESSIAVQQQRASTAVAAKNKTTALAALRSKKSAERALAQRSATLQQLEDVFTQIQQASDQVEVVETLRTSVSALKSLNKKVGSVDSVDAVLDDLREEMQKTSEVQNILAEPLTGDAAAVDVADAEVDEELEAMEREEQRKEDEKKAKETAARLQELEEVERKQKEQQAKEKEQKQPTDEELQAMLSKSIEDMRKMSINGEKEAPEKGQIPEAA